MADEFPPGSADRDWADDPRYKVSQRELLVAAIFFAVYIVVMIGVAWAVGGGDSIDEITYVLGFPAWFFWSALFFGAVFCVVPYFVVKFFFTDVSLEPASDDHSDPDGRTPDRTE